LQQLALEGHPPQHEIALKEVPAQTALSARLVAASEAALLPARLSLQTLLQENLERARLKPATPWFALVANNQPYRESNLEIELAIGVQLSSRQRAGDWGGGPVQLLELRAVAPMASLIHASANAPLSSAYTQLHGWAQSSGYQIAGAYREIYLPESGVSSSPQTELETGYTELQAPVQRASIPVSILSPQARKEQKMEPKIVTKPAFKAIGLSYVGKNKNHEIAQMWGVFNQRMPEIHSIDQSQSYGLCFASPKGAAEGEFEYVAACEVSNSQSLPAGMVYREVPEHKYAVFTHYGKLDNLGETYRYIYETWLPQSGLEVHPSRYDMEVYDERFAIDSDDSEFDIYLALK
ncbi:MAG TPA: hypothetical protein DEH25_08615, partial [Chloroflexi bacterium]|nr:hypothetical protein [Chloroflexota bacterium]